MVKVSISPRKIAAVKLFAAKTDVRKYLKGVYIEVGKTETRLVATDGICMAVVREPVETDVSEPVTAVIPMELLKNVKPSDLYNIEIRIGEREKRVGPAGNEILTHIRPILIKQGPALIEGKSFDSTFVDYRRVIPTEVSGEPAQFDHALLSRFGQAVKAWYKKPKTQTFLVGYNGRGPAIVDIGDPDFCGVLMPLRPNGEAKCPGWVKEEMV